MTLTSAQADALAPLRRALLRSAHADADACRRVATRDARRVLAGARTAAERILLEARTAGAADAAVLAAGEHAHARRTARAVVLAAQRHAYDELRNRVVAALRAEACDGRLQDRLTQRAAGVLGGPARISPTDDGGILGTSGNRLVDCSIDALADHAMAAAAAQVEEVWA